MAKKEQPKEVMVVEDTKKAEVASVESFITKAIETNTPVETMEKLFALRKEVKAEHAKEKFTEAMAKFQQECPVIEKTKPVYEKNSDKVRYSFAPLDSIVSQVKKPMGENGLSYSFDTSEDEKALKVVCTITHVLGHSKSSEFKIPIGTEAYMSDAQKYGARVTFAKRYAFCNALGILTGDEDVDAKEEKKKNEAKPLNVKANIIKNLKTLGANVSNTESIREGISKFTGVLIQDDTSEGIYKEVDEELEQLVTAKFNENS